MNAGHTLDIHDTIAASSSATGPGLRAIIRLSGPAAIPILQQLLTQPADCAHQSVTSRTITVTDVSSPVPVICYVWRNPRSYTGQDLVELHAPGSPPLVDRILQTLHNLGARSARPGEFTLRAFLAGKKDLAQSEAVHAVIQAREESDLRAALSRMAGGVSHPLEMLREDLLSLLADVEAELDFVEEDIQFVDSSAILARVTVGLAQLTNLRRQLDRRTVTDRPMRVVIVGEPNAGKSSLFNALTGQDAALVSEQADTTRDYLTARLELDGVVVELTDTAGWRTTTRTIESQAQSLGQERMHTADVLLWCRPADVPIFPDAPSVLPSTRQQPIIQVITKIDLEHDSFTAQEIDTRHVLVSVLSQQGMPELRGMISGVVRTIMQDAGSTDTVRALSHVELALQSLRRAHEHVRENDPRELLALCIRESLGQIGELVGAVYTPDLLDRIFSRFCIGK